jgi:hypothetical protein
VPKVQRCVIVSCSYVASYNQTMAVSRLGFIKWTENSLAKFILLHLKVTHFELVYEKEAILPVEVNMDALRIDRQNKLSAIDYHNLMLDRLDQASDERIKALAKIERDKLRVAKAYNKRVKEKLFQIGDLIWKTILPIRSKSNKFGKWSPNWEGPYKIEEVIFKNSYVVQSVQGTSLSRA